MEFLEHETNGSYHAWISLNYWTYLFIHCCINFLWLIRICSELKKKPNVYRKYIKCCLNLLVSLMYILTTHLNSNEMGGRDINTELVVLCLHEQLHVWQNTKKVPFLSSKRFFCVWVLFTHISISKFFPDHQGNENVNQQEWDQCTQCWVHRVWAQHITG